MKPLPDKLSKRQLREFETWLESVDGIAVIDAHRRSLRRREYLARMTDRERSRIALRYAAGTMSQAALAKELDLSVYQLRRKVLLR